MDLAGGSEGVDEAGEVVDDQGMKRVPVGGHGASLYGTHMTSVMDGNQHRIRRPLCTPWSRLEHCEASGSDREAHGDVEDEAGEPWMFR